MVLLFCLKTIYLIIYINDSHYGKQEEILSGSPSEGAHLRHRLHGHSKQHRLPSGPLPQPSPVWEGVITTDSWPHRQYIILPALRAKRSFRESIEYTFVSFEGSNLHCDARTGKGGGSEAEIEIVEGERIYCTAHQVGYYFNMDRNKPVRFPKEFLDYYESI